ncbi:MAG: hypothetical protein ACT4PT_07445 [Methanobacteriota archaeon]
MAARLRRGILMDRARILVLVFSALVATATPAMSAFSLDKTAYFSGTLGKNEVATHSYDNSANDAPCALDYLYSVTLTYTPSSHTVTFEVATDSYTFTRTTSSGYASVYFWGDDCEEFTISLSSSTLRDHKTLSYNVRVYADFQEPDFVICPYTVEAAFDLCCPFTTTEAFAPCPPPCFSYPCPEPMAPK